MDITSNKEIYDNVLNWSTNNYKYLPKDFKNVVMTIFLIKNKKGSINKLSNELIDVILEYVIHGFSFYLKKIVKIPVNRSQIINCIELEFDNASCKNIYHCVIPNDIGSAIGKMYLEIKLSGGRSNNEGLWRWTNKLGYALISTIELFIDEQLIDTQSGDWLNIFNELSGYDNITSVGETMTYHKDNTIVRIPLQFWFNQLNDYPLPIKSFDNNVSLKIELRDLNECICSTEGITANSLDLNVLAINLMVDCFDDGVKNIVFSNKYFINFVQSEVKMLDDKVVHALNLRFNHLIKYLVCCGKLNKWTSGMKYLVDNNCFESDFNNICIEASKKLLFLKGIYDGINLTYELPDGFIVSGYFISNSESELWENFVRLIKLNSVMNLKQCSMPIEWFDIPDNSPLVVKLYDHFNYGLYLDKSNNVINDMVLLLNGIDRFDVSSSDYFNYYQPYKYFNKIPSDGILTYSFSERPLDVKNGAVLNASRINVCEINFKRKVIGGDMNMTVYGSSLNCLVINNRIIAKIYI